jgi:hypothetical protein
MSVPSKAMLKDWYRKLEANPQELEALKAKFNSSSNVATLGSFPSSEPKKAFIEKIWELSQFVSSCLRCFRLLFTNSLYFPPRRTHDGFCLGPVIPQQPAQQLVLSDTLTIPQIMEFIKQRRENLNKLATADVEIRQRMQKIKAEILEELSKV